MNKGWHREPKRHSLAARGIKTKKLYRGASSWHIEQLKKNKMMYHPNSIIKLKYGPDEKSRIEEEAGIAGGVTSDSKKAKEFMFPQSEVSNSTPGLIIFKDTLKKEMQPVVYEEKWLKENKDVLEHMLPKTWTGQYTGQNEDGKYPLSKKAKDMARAEIAEEKEWFARKPVHLRPHIESINYYVTSSAAENYLKKRFGNSYSKDWKDYSERHNIKAQTFDTLSMNELKSIAPDVVRSNKLPTGTTIKVYAAKSSSDILKPAKVKKVVEFSDHPIYAGGME